MVVFALLIINKAGGLIYNREFHSGLNKLSSNDLLILAGTFHGVHAITRSLTPHRWLPESESSPAGKATGIEVLESSTFRMQCFQTITGTKFLLFTEPHQPNIDAILRRIYELYADYVMKNPFYTVEMPIRCEKFDRGLDGFVKAKA
ncbi:Sybindin-like family protein [Patellaria atrata CBS 101060]|uniref:Trafficking protein particle complex subunit n=1 Tax=Patellaria atrata CBS 101060 TaxID=1346257 RepID=A0A9P4S4Z8_9PEZI|nr:Sybindin-like family protein [Patellaria atrata CBS 101060]